MSATSIARQRLNKYCQATDTHATIQEMLEVVFSMRSVPRLYNKATRRVELCRQQAEVIQNHENTNVRDIGKGEAGHRLYIRLKLGGGQAYDRSND
jgi:hypothetical protein